MYNFNKILVKSGPSIELIVDNNSEYPLIDKGAHGAVFKISNKKCVKIYADKKDCQLESNAYVIAQRSSIVPRLYEVGENFIIIEYIKGTDLNKYLQMRNRMPMKIARQIVFMIREMERLRFTRRDSALRHIIIDEKNTLKVIDIVYAYTRKDPRPVKLFQELMELGLVKEFMENIKCVDDDLFARWNIEMQEYTC